ncbi:uncharacterized protein LOC62_06G008090 [Vanrija pseudolonga]|uniref:Uncharacterized protein n=1 Tax=Vanrija pseudolonga TaxID=143232 RepID=A0AAF0YHJ5_9TREE|nr:hypothetical protein LOC62_06G008090 [Vanrija pseudolonga]
MAAIARAAMLLLVLLFAAAAPALALQLNNRNLTTFLFPSPDEYWVLGAQNSAVWRSVNLSTDLFITNPFVSAFTSPVLLSSNSPPQWISIDIPANNSIVARAPPATGYTLFLTSAGVDSDVVAVSGQFEIKPTGTTPLSPQYTRRPPSSASRATIPGAALAAAAAGAAALLL